MRKEVAELRKLEEMRENKREDEVNQRINDAVNAEKARVEHLLGQEGERQQVRW